MDSGGEQSIEFDYVQAMWFYVTTGGIYNVVVYK